MTYILPFVETEIYIYADYERHKTIEIQYKNLTSGLYDS